MANRYTYNFTKWIWQHLPKRIVALKETSLWARLLKSLLKPVEQLGVPMANELIDAIFLSTAVDEPLEKHGEEYRLRRSPGETNDEYRARLISLRQSRRAGAVKGTLKALSFVYLGVIPEIVESMHNEGVGFKIGETKIAPSDDNKPQFYAIGVNAKGPYDELYRAFVYWIILPDLSDRENVPVAEFVRAIERVNYGGNEPVIFEKRKKVESCKIGMLTIGIDCGVLPRVFREAYTTKRYN